MALIGLAIEYIVTGGYSPDAVAVDEIKLRITGQARPRRSSACAATTHTLDNHSDID